MAKHIVAAVTEIPPGGRKLVTVRGREIGVFNVDGEFYALINRCPHQGAALCTGEILSRLEAPMPGEYRLTQHGTMLRCPWHCWEFDIRTGQSWTDPNDIKARTFDVVIEPGAALAKGPYVAELVPVSREEEYVVVEL